MSSHTLRIHQHLYLRDTAYRLIDAVCIGVSSCAAMWPIDGTPAERLAIVFAMTMFVHYIVAELSGLYRSWRGASLGRETACVALTWAYTVPAVMGVGLITNYNGLFPTVAKLQWIAATPLLMIGARIVIRKIQQYRQVRGANTRKIAICGVNDLAVRLARNLENSPQMGLSVMGFYDDRPDERTALVPDDLGRKVGNLEQLVDQARRGEVDMIYITFPMRAEDRIRHILSQLGDSTASVYIVPDFFVFELLHSRWTDINGLPAVSVFESPLFGVDGLVKRTADVVLGCLLLVLAALPMLLIAIAIKLTSPGPVFFRQKRYGLNGEEILVWKFRSMSVCEDGAEVRQAQLDDPRVTRIGQLIRRTSLDELPQLFNVLQGSMSLVGPRPHAAAHNEQYRELIDGYMLRHKVKPGITGLAQVNGWRGETETLEKMEKRVECDHQYIREWSLLMDLKILLKTIVVVVSRTNAY